MMNISLRKKYYYIFCIILFFAFITRILVWISFTERNNTFIQQDTFSYLRPGVEFVQDGSFSSFSRTPVFPIFLGFIYKFITKEYLYISFFQILLSVVTIIIWFDICRRNITIEVALLMSTLLSFDQTTIYTSNFLLSETLFTFILSLFIYLFFFSKNNLYLLILDGILLSILSLCRPIALLLFIPIIFYLFFFLKKRSFVLITCFVLCSISLPLLWTIRNYTYTGIYFFSTISSATIFEYRAAWIASRIENRDFYEVQKEFRERVELKKKKDHLNDGEIAEWEKKEGLAIIISHPVLTIRQGIEGFIKMYAISLREVTLIYHDNNRSYHELLSFLKKRDIPSLKKVPKLALAIVLWSIIHSILLYSGFVVSMFVFLRKDNAIRLLFIIVCYFTLLSIGAEAYSRFRVPIMPIISTLGASGLIFLKEKYKKY